jgi:hypothetical protein
LLGQALPIQFKQVVSVPTSTLFHSNSISQIQFMSILSNVLIDCPKEHLLESLWVSCLSPLYLGPTYQHETGTTPFCWFSSPTHSLMLSSYSGETRPEKKERKKNNTKEYPTSVSSCDGGEPHLHLHSWVSSRIPVSFPSISQSKP